MVRRIVIPSLALAVSVLCGCAAGDSSPAESVGSAPEPSPTASAPDLRDVPVGDLVVDMVSQLDASVAACKTGPPACAPVLTTMMPAVRTIHDLAMLHQDTDSEYAKVVAAAAEITRLIDTFVANNCATVDRLTTPTRYADCFTVIVDVYRVWTADLRYGLRTADAAVRYRLETEGGG